MQSVQLQSTQTASARKRKNTGAANASEIKRLKKFVSLEDPSENKEENLCAVCLCQTELGEELIEFPCFGQHQFHEACIMQWLKNQNSCPICRYELLTEDKEHNRRILAERNKIEMDRKEKECAIRLDLKHSDNEPLLKLPDFSDLPPLHPSFFRQYFLKAEEEELILPPYESFS